MGLSCDEYTALLLIPVQRILTLLYICMYPHLQLKAANVISETSS
jgi:hypothetical protein